MHSLSFPRHGRGEKVLADRTHALHPVELLSPVVAQFAHGHRPHGTGVSRVRQRSGFGGQLLERHDRRRAASASREARRQHNAATRSRCCLLTHRRAAGAAGARARHQTGPRGCSGDVEKKAPLGFPSVAIAVARWATAYEIDAILPARRWQQRNDVIRFACTRLAFTGMAAREATCTYARSRVVMSAQTARPTASPSCESCPRRTGGVHGRAVHTSHGVGLRADVAAVSEVGGRGSRRTAPMELVYSAGWLTPASGQPAAASLADTRRMSASVASGSLTPEVKAAISSSSIE